MTFDFLIEQNNKTLAFLKDQDFGGAIESALFALKYLKSSGLNDSAESTGRHNDEVEGWLDECMLLSEIKEQTSQHDDATTATHDFIYEHGISLHPSVTSSSIVTPILIFNTALAHHLAVKAGHPFTSYHQTLQKARKLYDLAYKIQEDIDSNVLFQFAVINNIAMIDRSLGNLAISNECLEYLMSVLMVLVDQGCTMRLRHVQGFLKNVIPSTFATAGAA